MMMEWWWKESEISERAEVNSNERTSSSDSIVDIFNLFLHHRIETGCISIYSGLSEFIWLIQVICFDTYRLFAFISV